VALLIDIDVGKLHNGLATENNVYS
jgi:hypothetical protein